MRLKKKFLEQNLKLPEVSAKVSASVKWFRLKPLLFCNISQALSRNDWLLLYWRTFCTIKCLKTCYTTNDVKLFETSKREDTDLFFRKRKWKHRQCNSQSRKSKNKKVFSCLTVVGTIFRQSVSKNYLCIFSKIKHHYLHPQKTLQSGRKVAYF